MQEYLSTKEAASRLGVTRAVVMGWIYRLKLPAMKRGWCWYVLCADVDKVGRDRQRALESRGDG